MNFTPFEAVVTLHNILFSQEDKQVGTDWLAYVARKRDSQSRYTRSFFVLYAVFEVVALHKRE
jgi:hypothetical protein